MTTVLTPRTIASTVTTGSALIAGQHTPVDATSAGVTVTLPSPATSGAYLSVEKIDSSANTVTVSGSIRGASTTVTIAWQYESVTFTWNGTTWRPTEGHKTKTSIDTAIDAKVAAQATSDTATYPARAYTVTLPAGLGWDSTNFPLGTVTLTEIFGLGKLIGSCTLTPESAFDAVSTARSAPAATYYVDSLNGSDANSGTIGSPYKSIGKAVAAANTGGVATKIIALATATYFRGNNPSTNAGAGGVLPTVDVAFIASGGRVKTGTYDSFTTPTTDATNTNCYTIAVTQGTLNRVVDIQNLNRDGNYTELVNVATAAICNVTPGSWAAVSGTLYIHRADGQPVTVSNTRYYRSASSSFKITSTTANVYIGGASGNDGWDVEGGDANGVLGAVIPSAGTARRVLAVANSTFRYGGGVVDSAAGRGVSVDSWNGLAIFSNCRADGNLTDGFNFHNTNTVTSPLALTINCSGFDNGRPGQQSCNGHTAHETVVAIDIAGTYRRNRGGTIRNINTTKLWAAGTFIEEDLGDLNLGGGGALNPTAVRMDDTAEMWADHVRTVMPGGTYAYSTGASGAKIHRRSCWPVAQPDSGPGTIDSY